MNVLDFINKVLPFSDVWNRKKDFGADSTKKLKAGSRFDFFRGDKEKLRSLKCFIFMI